MARYRVLNVEELEAFKSEFIRFLSVNGIDAKEWDSWRVSHPNKRDKFIDLFSDFIFQGIIEKTKYLVRWLPEGVQYLKVSENHASLLWFKYMEKTENSSMNQEGGNETINHISEVLKGEKRFIKEKTEEIFDLLNQGFSPLASEETQRVEELFLEYLNV